MVIMSDLTASITNKNSIELACRVDEELQKKIMALAIESAIKHTQLHDANEVAKISEKSEISASDLLDLIGLYISVIKVFMETDEQQFHDTMTAVGFSGRFIEKFPLKHKTQARTKRTRAAKSNN